MNKILVFIDWFSPAYKAGGPIVSVNNIIEHLAHKFKFYVVTSIHDIDEKEVVIKKKANTWLIKKKYSVIYLTRSHQKKFFYNYILNEINPDIIYLNSLFSIRFSILPMLRLKSNKRIILAPRGMLGDGALKIKSFKKKIFLKIISKLKVYKKITWHASTKIEKSEIEFFFGQSAKVIVAQNLSSKISNKSFKTKKNNDDKLNILFVSRISKKKNLLFLIHEINNCKRKDKIHLTIIGFADDISYCDLCLFYLKKYVISYEFLGSMPQVKLSEYYFKSDVFCLPTLHENYGHVIIEALSHGLPVIISNNTPWKNLENHSVGFDLKLKANNFCKKIEFFQNMNDTDYSLYSKNAIKYFEAINATDNLINENINLFELN